MSKKNPRNFAVGFLLICLFALSLTNCGGDVDSTGTIEGTVVGSTVRAAGAREEEFDLDLPLPDIQVCCFGECDVTDTDGFFTFGAVIDRFPGGDVLCTLTENGIETSIILPNVVPDPALLTLQFDFDNPPSVVIVSQESNPITDSPDGTPTVEPEPEPTQFPQPGATPSFTPDPEPTVTSPEPTEIPEPAGTAPVGPTGCALLAGQYTGNGGCELVGPVTVDASGSGLTISPFGSNGSVGFTINSSNPQSASSNSSDLTLFGKGGHSCTVSCSESSNSSFTVNCRSSVGSCSETFS